MKKTIITLLLSVLISTSANSQEITYSQELVKLANAGYADAQVALGLCFEQGRGIVKNIYNATVWYDKAAYNHKNPNGMLYLGNIRLHGPEELHDYDEAFKLLTKAANQKSTFSYRQSSGLVLLSYCYKDGKGTKKDVKKAIELFIRPTLKEGRQSPRENNLPTPILFIRPPPKSAETTRFIPLSLLYTNFSFLCALASSFQKLSKRF